ncbi:serine/threonine protein kinase [Candidatus Sumerlaeota bacterium]
MECLDVVGVPGLQRISRDFIPGYSLEQELGRGAMGMVFRAQNDKTAEEFAVKIIYPNVSRSSEDVARLCRESTITARLDHPNVVRSFGSGMSEGLHYIVFELVQGESLETVVEQKGCFAEREAAAIALEVAKGLEAAYALKIIHRDIKPQNILITPAGAVRITDFGLAKSEMDASLTAHGAFVGTPSYVSPEQIQSQIELDARTDLYSLGIVLFFLLTGQPPFADCDLPRLLSKKVVEEIPHPRTIKQQLSDGIVAIVQKLARRDREERFDSPTDVVRALEDYLQQQGPAAPQESADLPEALPGNRRPVAGRTVVDTPAKRAGAPVAEIPIPDIHHPILKSMLLKQGIPFDTVMLQADQVLFVEGDGSTNAYVLLAGELEILKAGKTTARISTQGEFIGEVSYLIDKPRTATVRAKAETILLKIQRQTLKQLLERSPELALHLAATLAGRLAAAEQTLESIRSNARSLETPFNRLLNELNGQ